MIDTSAKEMSIPVGVVLRRTPGVTRWAKWAWSGQALILNAPSADFRVLREADGVTDFHAATVLLTLYRDEVEGYRTALMSRPPKAFAILDKGDNAQNAHGLSVHKVTASGDVAMEYQDSAEMEVMPIPMPDALIALVRDFAAAHFEETEFRKRRRDRTRVDLREDGKGDPRIRQESDVFRSPAAQKRRADG